MRSSRPVGYFFLELQGFHLKRHNQTLKKKSQMRQKDSSGKSQRKKYRMGQEVALCSDKKMGVFNTGRCDRERGGEKCWPLRAGTYGGALRALLKQVPKIRQRTLLTTCVSHSGPRSSTSASFKPSTLRRPLFLCSGTFGGSSPLQSLTECWAL